MNSLILLLTAVLPYWQDPQVTSVNAETHRTEIVFFADRADAPAERLLWPGRASPSASQLLAFSPGKEQAAGMWET